MEMLWNELLELIVEEAYLMIPVLWFIGYTIKTTDLIRDCFIPSILTVLSIFFTPWLLGGYTPANIAQAILLAAGAVLANELYKQSKKVN